MTAFVVPFLRKKISAPGWTQAEMAEFYRVEAALIVAGMRVKTDRGLTDENDPWFVFFHADDEQEVIIHLARIGGSYLVSAPALEAIETGGDFHTLVRQLLARYDEIAVRRRESVPDKGGTDKSGKVVLHPTAMLWVLVALAFVKSAEARLSEGRHDVAGYDPALSPPRDSGGDTLFTLINFALQSVAVTWAVGAMASDVHLGSDDKFLSWLAGEPPVVAGTDVAFTTAEFFTANLADSGHDAPETGWTDHQGSGATPLPGIAAVAMSEHPILDHVNNQPENAPVASAYLATAAMPVVIEQAPPVAHPVAEARAVFIAAETNTALKSVESPPAVPDTIAAVLNHAIHPQGDDHGLVNDALSHLTVYTSLALPASATASAPAAAFSGHSADTTPVASVTSTTPTPVSVVAPPTAPAAMLDQSEVAVATSAVHVFLASVPQAVTIVSQNNLIVYDPLAVNIDLAHMQALTFDFADGSHISLVGLPSELVHALTGHS